MAAENDKGINDTEVTGDDARALAIARSLLGEISRISRAWIVAVTFLAFLSTIEVARDFDGDIAVKFHVTTITAIIVALAWLPALVRAVALTGGEVKTPAGEASARGILDILRTLDPNSKREILPPLAAALDSAEVTAGSSRQRGEARSVRRDIERELGASLTPTTSPVEALDDYSRQYEKLRSDLPSGSDRTFRMGSLMAEIRALASYLSVSPRIVKSLFGSGKEGDRVVALTLLEAMPLQQCLDQILDGIQNSRSAFEQFQALRAAEEALPDLGLADRRRLAEILNTELMDESGKGIHQDLSRLRPIEIMLAEIKST